MGCRKTRMTGPKDRGAAMVEFALVVPVLLLIVFGIINFGYLFGQQLALNQAVRAGARGAVVSGNGEAKDITAVLTLVQQAAQGSLISDATKIRYQNPAVDAATPPYVRTCNDSGVGQNLQVKVEYPTSALIPLFIPGFDNFDLKAEAVFRCEW